MRLPSRVLVAIRSTHKAGFPREMGVQRGKKYVFTTIDGRQILARQ